MSLTGAFMNAVSGLRVTGKSADLISQNISNATTPGYARRELQVSATSGNLVGGVAITGVTRVQDQALLGARRDAQAELGYATAVNSFFTRYESTLGTPDEAGALTNVVANFDAALVSAASRPDAPERLQAAVQAANALVTSLNSTAEDLNDMRTAADESIGSQISRLNAALEEVEYLNSQIERSAISGKEPGAIVDMRQRVIDEIHEMVPVRQTERELGSVALISYGGVILLDGSAREVEFDASNAVTPDATLAGGQLSGLTIGGFAVNTTDRGAHMGGGTIAAQFAIRDELAIDAIEQVDAAARNLIERFQDPAVDGTLIAGDAGLFTDNGAAFLAANEAGIAGRLTLNAAVDPDQGGETWRLRDGMNAAVPGNVGQSALIDSLRTALNDQRAPASGSFGTGTLSMTNLTNSLMSRVGVQRLSAEQSLSFTSASFFELSQAERAQGVDTDAELQQMLVIEKAYAANARMLQAADEMMQTLLGI